MRIHRPTIGPLTLGLLVAGYVLIVLNNTLWSKAAEYFAGAPLEWASFAIGYVALMFAGAAVFSYRYIAKPAFILAVVVSALVSYFVDHYGAIIDRNIIRDVFDTTSGEAGEYVTAALLLHMLLYGAIPSVLIAWVRLRHPSFLRQFARNALAGTAWALVCGIAVMASFEGIASTLREHGEMMETSTPGAPLVAAIKYAKMELRDRNVVLQPLGTDAIQGPLARVAEKPLVTVLVVGETARADHFSLNGYPRDTNPELSAADVVNYPNATSCGTLTAVSVPCMFSVFGKSDFGEKKARSTENLLDVLQHAGVDINWLDNNTGSKGVADRVAYFHSSPEETPALCHGKECLDQILVDRLGPLLDNVQRNTVIVLHMLGSHGPSYFLRYPREFALFKPDCHSPHLSECSNEQLVNAYDNTIAYTDHFLGQVIGLLKQRQDRLSTSMIYLSDHGESLGEDGLYLHGAPYLIAPEAQKHIPFLTWLSDDFAAAMTIDTECLRDKSSEPVSQDNLFHSVLGLMDVRTSVHVRSRDIFEACKAHHVATGAGRSLHHHG
ncbi:phosphoethanolamine transferase [Pseudaminobacter soli (ex Zhang et al. 2022)]|nr:phosphoethanolamine--lipid A transferase [Pseudaminobacter soli]